MSIIRVRYGRDKNMNPKNTLVTALVDGVLFFGIARCKTSHDKPIKGIGKDLAAMRCAVAIDDPWNTATKDGTFEVHKSGMLGCVDLDEKEKLLSYFRNIDEILNPRNR